MSMAPALPRTFRWGSGLDGVVVMSSSASPRWVLAAMEAVWPSPFSSRVEAPPALELRPSGGAGLVDRIGASPSPP